MNFKRKKHFVGSKRAITLIELIVTVIIVGILASFVVRGFTKTVDGANQKKARLRLLQIKASEILYCKRHGTCYPGVGATAGLADINTNLNLFIWNDPDFLWQCLQKGDPNLFECEVTYSKSGNMQWKYTIDQDMDMPSCTSGAMPCL